MIAKVKTGEGRFRVITGYDGDGLICPDFANAQERPEGAPTYAELDSIYTIGGKTTPRYGFIDGLKRIRRIMEYNIDAKIWDAYIGKMGWYGEDGLKKTDIEEKKARMKRVAETMWHTFNSHNFAEVFRQGLHAALKDTGFDESRKKIGACYGYTHDLACALIGLGDQLDWSNDWFACGFGEMIELTIGRIKQNDREARDVVQSMIEVLEGK